MCFPCSLILQKKNAWNWQTPTVYRLCSIMLLGNQTGEQSCPERWWFSLQERLRPPTYNAEDYAIALRRWGRRPLGSVQDSHGTLPSTTSSSSGYASGSGEMTLRQFTSVSELLNKLRADLRLAFPRLVCMYCPLDLIVYLFIILLYCLFVYSRIIRISFE